MTNEQIDSLIHDLAVAAGVPLKMLEPMKDGMKRAEAEKVMMGSEQIMLQAKAYSDGISGKEG